MKFLLAFSCYNERQKAVEVAKKFNDYTRYDVLILDDGSTDRFTEDLQDPKLKFQMLRNETNQGVGYSIRRCCRYAKEKGYDAIIFIAGNNKDSPEDVPKLIRALEEGYDFVQGSRYLPGGNFGNMPFYRQIATRYIHPWLFSRLTGKKMTDSTNGFRAFRLALLDDPAIRLDEEWLNHYELEPYLFYKAIKLGYRVKEVPVTKIYPPKALGYTKMKPVTGWWSILRPLIFLGLGIKK